MTKTTKMQVAQPTLKEELHRRAMGAREECQMVIQNDHDYTAADRKISEVAALAKAVKDFWHPLKRAARVSWELLRENEKGMLGPIEAGVETLTDTMKRYRAERERLDRERQEAEHLLQIEEAQVAMTALMEETFEPTEPNQKAYDELYCLYRRLHDAFGTPSETERSDVMKSLSELRDKAALPPS